MSKHMLIGVVVAALLTAPSHHGVSEAYAAVNGEGEGAQHCISTSDKAVECFATEAEALYVATGGRIVLAEGQTFASLSDEVLFAPDAGVAGVLYEHANYGGS